MGSGHVHLVKAVTQDILELAVEGPALDFVREICAIRSHLFHFPVSLYQTVDGIQAALYTRATRATFLQTLRIQHLRVQRAGRGLEHTLCA